MTRGRCVLLHLVTTVNFMYVLLYVYIHVNGTCCALVQPAGVRAFVLVLGECAFRLACHVVYC